MKSKSGKLDTLLFIFIVKALYAWMQISIIYFSMCQQCYIQNSKIIFTSKENPKMNI